MCLQRAQLWIVRMQSVMQLGGDGQDSGVGASRAGNWVTWHRSLPLLDVRPCLVAWLWPARHRRNTPLNGRAPVGGVI